MDTHATSTEPVTKIVFYNCKDDLFLNRNFTLILLLSRVRTNPSFYHTGVNAITARMAVMKKMNDWLPTELSPGKLTPLNFPSILLRCELSLGILRCDSIELRKCYNCCFFPPCLKIACHQRSKVVGSLCYSRTGRSGKIVFIFSNL